MQQMHASPSSTGRHSTAAMITVSECVSRRRLYSSSSCAGKLCPPRTLRQ
jgi:hypothetical protein